MTIYQKTSVKKHRLNAFSSFYHIISSLFCSSSLTGKINTSNDNLSKDKCEKALLECFYKVLFIISFLLSFFLSSLTGKINTYNDNLSKDKCEKIVA